MLYHRPILFISILPYVLLIQLLGCHNYNKRLSCVVISYHYVCHPGRLVVFEIFLEIPVLIDLLGVFANKTPGSAFTHSNCMSISYLTPPVSSVCMLSVQLFNYTNPLTLTLLTLLTLITLMVLPVVHGSVIFVLIYLLVLVSVLVIQLFLVLVLF